MRKINWMNVGLLISTVLTIVLLILTPTFNELANLSRSTNAYGGECLLWLLPTIFIPIYQDRKE